jgi:hypothetical protein
MKLIPVFATQIVFVLMFAAPAAAQIDLPDKPKKPVPANGVDLKRKPSGDIVPKLRGQSSKGGLELPPPKPGAKAPEPAAEPAPTSQAEAIFLELEDVRNASGELVLDAARSLVSMGAEGLVAAREGLGRDEPAILVASARALLEGGTPADEELVRDRAARRLPTRAVVPLLNALVEVTSGERQLDLLFDFCDHRQGGMRRHAAKLLGTRKVGLGHLLALAASKRSEARELSYQMMARLEDADRSSVDEELIGGLSDSSTRVAAAASEGLAGRIEGPGSVTTVRLLELARLRGLEDRRGAFALLSLVEAEDRLGRALIPSHESVNLLVYMRSGSPFVRAMTATALAGIGFRSEEAVPWLDLEVTHTLISSVAGGLYFPEYGVVRPAALRRLERITGQRFGDEGPLWKTWWVSHAEEFHALRAILPVTLADSERLEVHWTDPLAAESFRLLGPSATGGDLPFAGLSLRLVRSESEVLMRELASAGVFGAERLPGLVGNANGVERELEVSVGPASKAFRFGDGKQADWAEGVVKRLRELRDGAEWQLYPPPVSGEDEDFDFFAHEAPWWSAHRDPLERRLRLASLIVANMKAHSPSERGPSVEALERLPEGSLSPELFDPLSDRLAEEDFFGDRARRILALALGASRDADGRLGDDAAGRLIDILITSGDAGRAQEIAMVLTAASPVFQRGAAMDPRSSVRAVTATVLARRKLEVEDRALLEALLADASLEVEAAAVLAVSEAGLVEFREAVWARARVSQPLVRRAAIRGAGRLGGARALDVLRLAMLDSETSIKLAGAAALADLAEPASTTLLIQMLASGEGGPFFEDARRGLVAIGEPAWDALLLLARSSTSPAQHSAMLMLAEQEVTEVAPILITTLTEDPSDLVVARELAILTGADFRDRPNPAGDWWIWRDGHHDGDSVDWFCQAYNNLVAQGKDLELASAGVHLVPGELRGSGTLEGAGSLVELLRADAPAHLMTRALRELRRLIGQDFGSLPPRGHLRGEWCDVLLERLPVFFEEEISPPSVPTPGPVE